MNKQIFPNALGQPQTLKILTLGFAIVNLLLALGGLGKVLNLLFPVSSLALGWLLYKHHSGYYIGFVWWLWFLSPLLRRLADFYGGSFTNPSPILLTPYLIVLISLGTLFDSILKKYRPSYLPFVFCFSSLLYGLLVGFIYNSPTAAIVSFLDWLAPPLFAFYILVNWRTYRANREITEKVFQFGLILMSVYGVYQYLFLPEWDRFWIVQSEMASSGTPEPMLLNIHSTMNDRGIFAAYMMASLLIVLQNNSFWGILSFPVGFLAMLLTTVRTMWVVLFLGILTLFISLRSSIQIRFIIMILIISLCSFPLVTLGPFADRAGERVESFSNLGEDDSFQSRTNIYADHSEFSLGSIVGYGMGGGTGDSGVLTTFLQLGFLGTGVYVLGIANIISTMFRGNLRTLDQFAHASRAIVLSLLTIIAIGNPLAGVTGFLTWAFLGYFLASKKYHENVVLLSSAIH